MFSLSHNVCPFLVSYKADDTPNDVKLIGIFDSIVEGESLEVYDHYGFAINSPIHPTVVPRFSTMEGFTERMSQVITDFTGIETTISAVYTQPTEESYGQYFFDIQVKKDFLQDTTFEQSVSLGDLTKLSVEESSLSIGGSFLLSNEFGVILGPDDTKGLKIISQLGQENCISSDQSVDFDIILYRDDDTPIIHNITIASCSDGASARVETIRSSVNDIVSEEDVTVSLVGSSSLVLAFNPFWSKVQVHVPEENIYGLTNLTQNKVGWHFANGATALEISLGLSGGAEVSANILDSIEVTASVDASMSGSLQFNSGSRGQLISMDTWFTNMRTIVNPSDEFYDPDFASCELSVDGSLRASVDAREPFALDVPVSFEGFFVSPFELNLLDLSAVETKRPDIDFDIELPEIGNIGELSFGNIVNLLQMALAFLVGNPDDGHTIETCTGGILGKRILGKAIFSEKIPIIGLSACEFTGYLQILVNAVDQLVNDCTDCNSPDAPKSTFNVLEKKLSTLLQDTVGGSPSVVLTPASNGDYSSLDVDITLQWSFVEVRQLSIDLAAILEGMDLDENLKNFAKGIIALNRGGGVEIEGSLSLRLGVGLEYTKPAEVETILDNVEMGEAQDSPPTSSPTVHIGSQTAYFDAGFGAPRCDDFTSSCDTGFYLVIGAGETESHNPNT